MTSARSVPSHPIGSPGAVPDADGATRTQVAALCMRDGPAGAEVLLVTSRGTGRWILPKGWPMAGRTLAEAAAREAWEEAGVRGSVEASPIGSFAAEKVTAGGVALPCRVSVFRLHVEGMDTAYPEAGQRDLRWVSPEHAADLVEEQGLSALLRAI